MPAKAAVPLPLSTKIIPLGSAPVRDRAGVGEPVAVNWNEAGCSTGKVVVLALVIAGAEGDPPPDPALTTRVKS